MLMTDKNLLFGRQVAAAEVLKGVQQFCHCEVPGIGMFIRVARHTSAEVTAALSWWFPVERAWIRH